MKNALVSLLKLPVLAYQYLISPFLPPRCRFHPTCSAYCLQALEKHGALGGLWLTLKRISKCHPFSGCSGYDPVPEPKQKTIDKDAKQNAK